jgi:ribosomal protein S18 acetylase RimI-like enzyme
VIRAFTEHDLDAAAALLAARHGRHREAEPLLPADVDFRAQVDELYRGEGAEGAVVDGAFVLGAPRPEKVWGPNVWVETAGHAADDPELLRDAYSAAAERWLARGLKAQYVLVPASDGALVDAWFRLGFGAQQAHGIAEVPETPWPAEVREAEQRDVESLVALAPFLSRHQQRSPVFGPPAPWTEDDVRADVLEDLERDDVANLVVERDGRIVGNFVVAPVELASMHIGLGRPPGAAYLAFAITHPDARGSGAGVALTDASFAWARARGHTTMVTDWRVTNLVASRFWPRRGFRTSFLRLHRLIA